jgi:hypothetical protein
LWGKLRAAGRFFSAVAARTEHVSEEVTVGLLERGAGKLSLRPYFLQVRAAELGEMKDGEIDRRLCPPPRIEVTVTEQVQP